MSDKVLLRNEVDQSKTWDLKPLIADDREFESKVELLEKLTKAAEAEYKGKINSAESVVGALKAYENFSEVLMPTTSYTFLAVSVDMTNDKNASRFERFSSLAADWESRLSFIKSSLVELDESVLKAAIDLEPEYKCYLKEIIRFKSHALHPEAERALKSMSDSFTAPFNIYNKAKFADLDYPPLEVDGKTYPMSFVTFESNYDTARDTNFRRTAFKAFSKELRKYQNTFGATLTTQMKREKAEATLRGFDSVIDFLLFDQKVTREMYDRQIDTIMEKLAPAMRKYAGMLGKINKIDKMTFADLKTSIDYDFEPSITIDESKEYILNALGIYGDDYKNMLERAYSERWIDFVNNKGKRSGAFCASPYGAHPYILITWSERMREVFVLAHELGHAGHFSNAQKHQNVFNARASLYFIEAPSTMNELLMANYLKTQKADDLRFKRWVLSSMVSRTYYHNFVTHLLEAHFQREVYKIIDNGGSVQANDLNRLKRESLEKFWGDAVDVSENAELTWMRQLHYYKGLYPYTYSAGLTIATAVNRRIEKEGLTALEDWKNVLKAGGTKTPLELAQMAKVDISTDKPLLETIDYISAMIDEIEDISKQLGDL